MDNEVFLSAIQKLLTVLPQKFVLRLAGISAPAYYYRICKSKISCELSPVFLCLRKHPLQLALKEVNKMKELFTDARFACWPVASIAHYARINGLLYASLSTWYKYSSLLGFKKLFPKPDVKTKGVTSLQPNEFLHVDTTFYTLPDGTKSAITFVSDNFSRMILGWSMAERNCAENVKAALSMAIENTRKYYPQHICTTLMADGGSENHALTIEELIAATPHPKITKVIALKDIGFSNSPIEAINKIIKRYLRFYDPGNSELLRTCIVKAVEDYCTVRPHNSLKGLTPVEVYSQNFPNLDFSQQTRDAKASRIELNRKSACNKC